MESIVADGAGSPSPRQIHGDGVPLYMAVAGNCTGNLASPEPVVNTDHATCGHRACKAFTGASALLKSSLAGVAVVTRLRVPGPARSGRSWRPVCGTRHRASAMKSETGGFADFTSADMRCASSAMSGTEQGPDRKTAGLPFMANHIPDGAVACHPVASTRPGRSIPDGEPCSPTGAAFPFASRRRTAMCASQATRAPRPVGVLLGGSGRVRAQVPPAPRLAALLRPAAA
mmetsp:Transcript_76643/g.212194  ORF Transcript_76643/g.212194 Transcript_76643/m.212194 type:complete len:230 (-) Transcript_76643:299-988(-)